MGVVRIYKVHLQYRPIDYFNFDLVFTFLFYVFIYLHLDAINLLRIVIWKTQACTSLMGLENVVQKVELII